MFAYGRRDVDGMHPRTSILCLALLIVAVLGTGAPAEAAPRTFTVTTTVDRPDTLQGNGICAISGGGCSRCARRSRSRTPTRGVARSIELPAGVYELEIPTLNEDLPGTGDHDITDGVTINGVGAGVTIIDGGFPLPGRLARGSAGSTGCWRSTAARATSRSPGLTLREGYAEEDGGAIQNWSTGRLRLEDVRGARQPTRRRPAAASTTRTRASIHASPSARSRRCRSRAAASRSSARELSGNAAGEGGAAVNNASTGTVAIRSAARSPTTRALMIPDPAQVIDPLDPEPIEFIPGPGRLRPRPPARSPTRAEFGAVGTIRIADSTVAGNYATANGAGVHNAGDGTLDDRALDVRATTPPRPTAPPSTATAARSTIDRTARSTDNLAHANGGALYSDGRLSEVGLRSRSASTARPSRTTRRWANARRASTATATAS